MEEEEKKNSVWDNFDIGKISNARFKLEFISLNVHGDATVCEEIYTTHIWMRLPGLDFKYWSPKGWVKYEV